LDFSGSFTYSILVFSETWLKSRHSNQLVAFDGFNVFRCDRSRAAGGGVALFVNRSINFHVLVFFRFNDVYILVGSTYRPDQLHFDENRAFLEFLALVSLDFDNLLDPKHSTTSRYRDILDFLSISFLRYHPLSQSLFLTRASTTF
jgi:hypothetical protein